MNAVFIKLFDVSTVASISIILTLLFRPLLKKCPSFIRCILWCVILLRLLLPFTIDSGVFTMQSVPSASDIFAHESVAEPEQPTVSQAPVVDESRVPFSDSTISAVVPDISVAPPVMEDAVPPVISVPDTEEAAPNVQQVTEMNNVSILSVISVVWIVGLALMLLYMAVSSIVLSVKTRNAIVYDSRIRIINAKTTPFIRGIIRPTIYIPSGLDKGSWPHIIAHENAHLKRLDHLVKPMAFIALAMHWYNPLVWVAYIMLCKDIEYACDEKAVKPLNHAERQAYSLSLLSCAAGKSLAFAHPLAFGKVSVKERIKRIMNYKVSVWAVCLALIVCMLLGLLLACSPGDENASSADGTSDDTSYEQSEYFGSLTETTDDSGHHKGFTLKADEWEEITAEVTNELLADIKADFTAIWEGCDFVTIDFGKTSSLALEKSEYELPGNGYGYTASLSTPFNSYSFTLYDHYYDFKHIKVKDGKLVFEKPSAFGEASEKDTESLGTLDKLMFIRLIYGLKPDADRVRNYDITSGVYSDAATIVISPTQSVVCWRGIDVSGHWWISAGEKVKVLYSDEFKLKNDKENTTLNVLEYDDGGHEIVKILPTAYVKSFKFVTIEYDENSNPKVGKVLYEADVLNSKQPFYAKTMINEGLSFRGVVYTDSFGFTYYARIMFNSKSGELYLDFFTPPSTTTPNNRMEVSYGGQDLENDKSNPEIKVLEFDDGGHEIVKILPTAYVKSFKFVTIEYDENSNPKVGKVLYEADVLNSKQPFYAKTMINEGLSFRGVVYTDSLGFTYYARIMFNSKDGGLYLDLFAPPEDVNNRPNPSLPVGDWYSEVVSVNEESFAILLSLNSDNSVRYDYGYAYSEIMGTFIGTWKTEGNVLTLSMAKSAGLHGPLKNYVFEWKETENGISLTHVGEETFLYGFDNATFNFTPILSHASSAPIYPVNQ